MRKDMYQLEIEERRDILESQFVIHTNASEEVKRHWCEEIKKCERKLSSMRV